MIRDFQMYYTQIGLNISYYRKMQNLSQLQLAEAANLSRTHISNIEAPNAETRLSLESLFIIAQALHISPNKLLEFRSLD